MHFLAKCLTPSFWFRKQKQMLLRPWRRFRKTKQKKKVRTCATYSLSPRLLRHWGCPQSRPVAMARSLCHSWGSCQWEISITAFKACRYRSSCDVEPIPQGLPLLSWPHSILSYLWDGVTAYLLLKLVSTSCSTSTDSCNIRWPGIQEQCSGKADGATAMEQMLQPYKLGEYYA